jgi:integrase
METAQPGVAGYIAGWQPVSVSGEAACFARQVAAAAAPATRARANALLWAAARLAAFAVPLGLEAVPQVLLHPSVIERFAVGAPGLPPVARRTLRTNLRFLARRVVPALSPADAPLPRERAKAPYSPGEIDGYLALADAQPTAARRMRAAGLVCLGAGAGLAGTDLRSVRGADVTCRSGGMIVEVRGRRPRTVSVGGPGDGAGTGPLPQAAARRGGVLRDRPGHRRDPGAQEHHHAADRFAVRRDRAAPAGGLPAAVHLAG